MVTTSAVWQQAAQTTHNYLLAAQWVPYKKPNSEPKIFQSFL